MPIPFPCPISLSSMSLPCLSLLLVSALASHCPLALVPMPRLSTLPLGFCRSSCSPQHVLPPHRLHAQIAACSSLPSLPCSPLSLVRAPHCACPASLLAPRCDRLLGYADSQNSPLLALCYLFLHEATILP